MSYLTTDARLQKRRGHERRMRRLMATAAALAGGILIVLIARIIADGLPVLDRDFWLMDYDPLAMNDQAPGRSGIADSITATLSVLTMTMLFAVPVGTAAGIYLHEYAGRGRLTEWIRATVSNLAGVPSIIYGLLGLAIFVRLLAFGATNISSALTLAVLILPILIVATEEALKTVPQAVRDASLALGASKWQTIRWHVLPYALPGILTGQILALSRAAGETAPLIVLSIPAFTPIAGGGPFDKGTPLQLRAYTLANQPSKVGIADGWGAILVLLVLTLALNVLAIILRNRASRRIRW